MTYLVAECLIKFVLSEFFLYIYNLPAEAQAELLPAWGNAYHDPNWTDEECEF